jgi:hypothetical protein
MIYTKQATGSFLATLVKALPVNFLKTKLATRVKEMWHFFGSGSLLMFSLEEPQRKNVATGLSSSLKLTRSDRYSKFYSGFFRIVYTKIQFKR